MLDHPSPPADHTENHDGWANWGIGARGQNAYIRPQRPTVTTGDSAPDQGLLIYFTVIETKVYNIIYYTFVDGLVEKKKYDSGEKNNKKMFTIKTARSKSTSRVIYYNAYIYYYYYYNTRRYNMEYAGLRSEIRQSETDLSYFEHGTCHRHNNNIILYECLLHLLKCIHTSIYRYQTIIDPYSIYGVPVLDDNNIIISLR